MRLCSFLLVCALSIPTLAFSQAGSREEVRALLIENADRFEEALQDVNESQWSYQAPAQRHTIGALAEHTAISTNDLQTIVQRALDAGPQPDVAKTLTGEVELVKGIMLSVEQPPENFKPAGRLATKADIDEYYPQVRAKALALLDSARNPELCVYGHPSRRIDQLTAVQWFYYIAYLIQAHTEQIERIKADPGYPQG